MGYLFGSKLNLKIVNDLITKRRSELGIYENFFVAHNVYGISEQVETAEKGPDGKKIKVYVHLFYDEFRKAKEMRAVTVNIWCFHVNFKYLILTVSENYSCGHKGFRSVGIL